MRLLEQQQCRSYQCRRNSRALQSLGAMRELSRVVLYQRKTARQEMQTQLQK